MSQVLCCPSLENYSEKLLVFIALINFILHGRLLIMNGKFWTLLIVIIKIYRFPVFIFLVKIGEEKCFYQRKAEETTWHQRKVGEATRKDEKVIRYHRKADMGTRHPKMSFIFIRTVLLKYSCISIYIYIIRHLRKKLICDTDSKG